MEKDAPVFTLQQGYGPNFKGNCAASLVQYQ
jgi:hypothetical protein